MDNKGRRDMKKYWKMILAVVIVVAVAATIAVSTIDWKLQATDDDGEIAGVETVEQNIEVYVPETEAEPEPETTIYTEPEPETIPEIPETIPETVPETIPEETFTEAIETEPQVYNSYDQDEETIAEIPEESEAAETTEEQTKALEETKQPETPEEETTKPEEETTRVERSIRLISDIDGLTEVKSGTMVTMTAILSGFDNCEYEIQWQRSLDGQNWENVENGNNLTYTFELTKDTIAYVWNAKVTIIQEK